MDRLTVRTDASRLHVGYRLNRASGGCVGSQHCRGIGVYLLLGLGVRRARCLHYHIGFHHRMEGAEILVRARLGEGETVLLGELRAWIQLPGSGEAGAVVALSTLREDGERVEEQPVAVAAFENGQI